MITFLKGGLGAALFAGLVAGGATRAGAAGEAIHIELQNWSFAGVFGRFDRGELQRGYQVYAEVCSACHSLEYLYYRNLADPGGPGFTEAEAGAIAAGFEVSDGPDEDGEMFARPALPRDRFASPFANDEEARAINGGALPPDLSVIAKARGIERGFPWWLIDLFTGYQEQGADYLYALLSGYEDAPADFALQSGMQYNIAFPGHQIAMPAPLSDDLVEYADGTPATVSQMARDVTAFLMWAAEPKLEERKRAGFQVMLFLAVFATLLYLTKKKVWSRLDH
jgi:ubiquinol-cytochrome c reductase cytochrome b/c1 subunit